MTQNSHNRSGPSERPHFAKPAPSVESGRVIYADLFLPLGGSADSVLSQIAAQRKRAAGLMDVKPPSPEKTQTQSQSQPPAPPSVPTLLLPDTSLPDINSHPSLAASDVHSRRVCVVRRAFFFKSD